MDEVEPNDRQARALVLAIAGARIAIGAGACFATRRAIVALGFDEPGGAAVALARLAGGRDIALGVHALSVRDRRHSLKQATALGAAVDAGDALAFGAALAARDGIDRTAALNAPLGAGAALAGLWALRRL